VLRLARDWSRAHSAWTKHDGGGREDDRLYEVQNTLHKRLEAAAHELVAVEDELDRQRRDGWHLVDVTIVEYVDGERVETDARYLETGAP
jgi:hypothetical protein